MTQHFRRLTLDDKHDYLTLMLAAYAPIKALGIQFDAATADLVRVTQH
ncbi:GNAT family N-acetyltransferase, partial [Klebsiella variicola]